MRLFCAKASSRLLMLDSIDVRYLNLMLLVDDIIEVSSLPAGVNYQMPEAWLNALNVTQRCQSNVPGNFLQFVSGLYMLFFCI